MNWFFVALAYSFIGACIIAFYWSAYDDAPLDAKPPLPLWTGTLLFLGWPIAGVIGIIIGSYLFGRALYREAAEFFSKKGTT